MNSEYEVRIYDYDGAKFSTVGTTYETASMSYTENCYSPGVFTINIPTAAMFADEFKKYRFVHISRRFCGIITGVTMDANNSADMLTVSGTNLFGLLAQRVTIPPNFSGVSALAGFDSARGSSETVIKHFVNSNIVAPYSNFRKIPGFRILPDLGRGIADDRYLSRYENLADVVGAVGKDAKLPIVTAFNLADGTIDFDVKLGVDRTAANGLVPPVIIDTERRTALSANMIDSDGGLRNAFYSTMAGAEFEDEALTLVYYRDADELAPPQGIFRRETHMELNAEHPTPGQEYDELKRLALISATNYEAQLSFRAEVNFATLQYARDYFLGDKVTVRRRDWGVTLDSEVTSVTASLAAGNISYTATFGTERPDFARAIRRASRR